MFIALLVFMNLKKHKIIMIQSSVFADLLLISNPQAIQVQQDCREILCKVIEKKAKFIIKEIVTLIKKTE